MKKNTKWTLAVILAAMLAVTATTAGCTDAPDETDGTVSATEAVTDTATDPATDTTATATATTATATAETDTSSDPDSQETSAATDAESATAAGDTGVVEPVENDEPLLLVFDDDYRAKATVLKEREITILTSSSSITIRGEGSFTVRYEGENGTETVTPENGELTIASTAAPHAGMVLIISSESRIELDFSLNFDLGHENNPHIIAPEGATTISFKKETSVRIQTAGWYSFDNDRIDVTNYAPDEAGRVFLPVGVHGLSFMDGGDITLTLTLEEVPDGYSTETPAIIANPDEPTSLKLYSGAVLYYSFTAPETGMYTVAMGTEGKSVNCRFTTSLDGYTLQYGRYYDGEEWLTCEGGRTSTVFLAAGQTVILAVDYSLGENLVGNDDVAVVISAAGMADVTDVTEMGDNIEGSLATGGQVFYRFTASEKGIYTVNLGAGATNKISHFTTDLDAGGSYAYGEIKRMPLEAGQTVYVIVSADGDTAGRVSIQVNRLTDEPLPAEGWMTGTYEGSGMALVLDRDAKSVSMGAQTGIKLNYLDGEGSFSVEIGGEKMDYLLRLAEDGTNLIVTYYKEDQPKEITLIYQAPVDPVAIEKWEGVYASETGIGGVTELTIYPEGSGLFGYDRFVMGENGTKYNSERNILQWSGRAILKIESLNEQGKVTAISVTVGEETVIYTLTDKVAVRLPDALPIENGSTYISSEGYTLQFSGSYQMLNSAAFTIIGHPDEATYLIAGYDPDMEPTVFKLVFDGTERVTVYAESGEQVAALELYVPEPIPDLKADGSVEDTSVKDSYYISYLRIPADGWYTFRTTEEVTLYTNCTRDEQPTVAEWSDRVTLEAGSKVLFFEKGAVVGFAGGQVTATYSTEKPSAPLGSADYNPFIAEGQLYDAGWLTTTDVIYVQFTAPAAGSYQIGADFDKIHLSINGEEYGKYYDDNEWKYVECESGTVCTLTLDAGETVVVALNRLSRVWDTPDAIKLGFAPEGQLDKLLGLSGGEEASFNASQQGIYSGFYDKEKVTLTIRGESIDITYFYDSNWDGTNDTTETLTGIKPLFDGTYYTAHVEIAEMEWNVSFYFADGKVQFSVEGVDYFTLSAGSGEQVGGEDYFTEEQKGTYTNGTIQLTIHEDGSVSYDDGEGNSVERVFPTFGRGAYIFKCNGQNVIFQMAEDGSISLRKNGVLITLPKLSK